MRWTIAVFGLALGLLDGADLSPQELRGRAIFRTGASSTPIIALVGAGATEVEATVVPCAGCHGLDGRGRTEGGIAPPPIRWPDLARRQPAYSEHLLIRAITLGFDSSGAQLKAAMPRYQLSQADLSDLIAYLKKLADDRDPGITDDSVRIGVVLPPGGSSQIRAALTAYFTELNRQSGIYGRRVELVFSESPTVGLSEFLRREAVFALLSSYTARLDQETSASLAAEKIAVVGTWTLLPGARESPTVFHLNSGIRGQAEALVSFARDRFGAHSRIALIASTADWPGAAAVVESIRHALGDASNGDAALLLLQEVEVLEFIRHRKSRQPLLIPGSLATTAILEELRSRSYPERVFLAVPPSPSDATTEATAQYAKLKLDFHLPDEFLSAQYQALAEAAILAEALRRVGRYLSREALLQSLEGFYDFAPGFAPPVTFGPNRHEGSHQFRIVQLDPKTGHLVGVNDRRLQ